MPNSPVPSPRSGQVSMESGLEDRNNLMSSIPLTAGPRVSMESGLEDRNNQHVLLLREGFLESQWSPA